MWWNFLLLLIFLYLTFGLLDHIINVCRFLFSKEEKESDKKHKLTENK